MALCWCLSPHPYKFQRNKKQRETKPSTVVLKVWSLEQEPLYPLLRKTLEMQIPGFYSPSTESETGPATENFWSGGIK